ncbi:unnamed protein product [Amoebophrya sp. A120]|nr:unnamed protein product [Amoebophrya sp. A120]|eukprot:GSA120T00018304001.1
MPAPVPLFSVEQGSKRFGGSTTRMRHGENMRIAVGTTNPIKVLAVQQSLHQYSEFMNCKIQAYKVASNVSEQPFGLPEIVRGAKNRAEAAYDHIFADTEVAGALPNSEARILISFGIESGLYRLDGSVLNANDPNGWYDTCVVSCFDGRKHHLGSSCSFEIPKNVMQKLLPKKVLKPSSNVKPAGGAKDSEVEVLCENLSDACKAAGVTDKANLGEQEGLIGILTKGRITRLEYTKQAVLTSIVGLLD